MDRILVTGSGGIGGVNFVNALKVFKNKFFIVGTDYNKYYLQFPDVNIRVNSPKHTDPQFIKTIIHLVEKNKLNFVHPQPSSEALVISKNRNLIPAKVFLPDPSIIEKDKLITQQELSKNSIPVAKTETIEKEEQLEDSFEKLGEGPLWVRAKTGAGGNLSLLVSTPEEAKHWIKLWVIRKKINFYDFLIQEFLPGRNAAWDSIWHEGKLIASFTRERLEYPLKHISPSGITGTPSVSKIIFDESINQICEKAIKIVDKKPHGNYAVDLKENNNQQFCITEIDSGKFHTTTPLWGLVSTKLLKQEPTKNIPYLYTQLGLGNIDEPEVVGNDIYPAGLYLLRHIDCGTWIWTDDGKKEQIL